MKNKFYEIRCPCIRKHVIGDIEYDRCGSLLGAIAEDDVCYFRCQTCGMVLADNTDGNLELTILGKRKIEFDKVWRRVKDER